MAEIQLQQTIQTNRDGMVDELKSRKEKDQARLERMRKLEDPKSKYTYRKANALQSPKRPQTAKIGGLYSTGYPTHLNEPAKKPAKAYVSPYS